MESSDEQLLFELELLAGELTKALQSGSPSEIERLMHRQMNSLSTLSTRMHVDESSRHARIERLSEIKKRTELNLRLVQQGSELLDRSIREVLSKGSSEQIYRT